MPKPYANIADLLLPERKLWDGNYGVALVNTANGERGDRPAIRGADDVLSLGEHLRVLRGAFAVTSEDRDAAGDATVDRVRELLDIARQIADAGLRNRHPAPKVVERLAPFVDAAFAALRFGRDGKSYTVALDARGLERVVHLTAFSLGDLLISGGFTRVRGCSSEGCAYLFVDRSPGLQRLYCHPKTCGAAAKVKRKTARRRKTKKARKHPEWHS